MKRWKVRSLSALVGLITALPAHAQERPTIEAGMLTCEVGQGVAFILSSPRDLHCVFHKANGQNEAYRGTLQDFGANIGVSGRGVIAWTVLASTTRLPPGELKGAYGGVEAGAAVGLGGAVKRPDQRIRRPGCTGRLFRRRTHIVPYSRAAPY